MARDTYGGRSAGIFSGVVSEPPRLVKNLVWIKDNSLSTEFRSLYSRLMKIAHTQSFTYKYFNYRRHFALQREPALRRSWFQSRTLLWEVRHSTPVTQTAGTKGDVELPSKCPGIGNVGAPFLSFLSFLLIWDSVTWRDLVRFDNRGRVLPPPPHEPSPTPPPSSSGSGRGAAHLRYPLAQT